MPILSWTKMSVPNWRKAKQVYQEILSPEIVGEMLVIENLAAIKLNFNHEVNQEQQLEIEKMAASIVNNKHTKELEFVCLNNIKKLLEFAESYICEHKLTTYGVKACYEQEVNAVFLFIRNIVTLEDVLSLSLPRKLLFDKLLTMVINNYQNLGIKIPQYVLEYSQTQFLTINPDNLDDILKPLPSYLPVRNQQIIYPKPVSKLSDGEKNKTLECGTLTRLLRLQIT